MVKNKNSQDFETNHTLTKLQLLDYLKDKNLKFDAPFGLQAGLSKKCIKNHDGVEVIGDQFALYELTTDDELSIKSITSIKNFTFKHAQKKSQEALLSCINKSVQIYKKDDQVIIPDGTKVILGLFYIPSEYGKPSFIDQYGYY